MTTSLRPHYCQTGRNSAHTALQRFIISWALSGRCHSQKPMCRCTHFVYYTSVCIEKPVCAQPTVATKLKVVSLDKNLLILVSGHALLAVYRYLSLLPLARIYVHNSPPYPPPTMPLFCTPRAPVLVVVLFKEPQIALLPVPTYVHRHTYTEHSSHLHIKTQGNQITPPPPPPCGPPVDGAFSKDARTREPLSNNAGG